MKGESREGINSHQAPGLPQVFAHPSLHWILTTEWSVALHFAADEPEQCLLCHSQCSLHCICCNLASSSTKPSISKDLGAGTLFWEVITGDHGEWTRAEGMANIKMHHGTSHCQRELGPLSKGHSQELIKCFSKFSTEQQGETLFPQWVSSPHPLGLPQLAPNKTLRGAQYAPPQNIPPWHIDYFELKLLKKQPMKEAIWPFFVPPESRK